MHKEIVKKIIVKQFSKEPDFIERMAVGSGNEVYSVKLNDIEYIVRLNAGDSLKGSDKYIPLFKSKEIKVPEIIAKDYSKELVPYNWQIMNKIEGKDIDKVISELSESQLDNIAKEIKLIVKKLIVLPTNGKFGYVGITKEKLKLSLLEETQAMLTTIRERNNKTNVVKNEYINVFKKVIEKYKSYLENAPSQFYFDDMSSKNVMIHEGKFNGIVDLDGVTYGDYLEGIGRIKASWYGTKYGDYYATKIMDYLELNQQAREMVTMWALLNRIYWQAEIGVQLNQNTSTKIDQKKVEEGNKIIERLTKELNLNINEF